MLLHAVAVSLLYVDSRGVDERVDLAECLATNKPRSNHPPVCYLTLPQGVNSFDLEVTGRPFEGDGFEVYRAQEWDAALLELAAGTKTVRHPQQVAARHLKLLWGGFSEAERRPFWAQAQVDAGGERWGRAPSAARSQTGRWARWSEFGVRSPCLLKLASCDHLY